MNIPINFMMMRKIILFLTGFGFLNLYAQEQPAPREISIAQEDVQKIRQHLAQNYRIPTKVLLDSIRRINYQISFTIDEEGRIVEPNIIYKNSEDRKSTRLNSSHVRISYAVFCLKKK